LDAKTPDGRYDRTKPWVPNVEPSPMAPRWQYLGPFASNEERMTQRALQAAILPGAELAEMVRPPLPQVVPFRDRYGYDNRVPTIFDIMDVGRTYDEPRISWFSGGPAGYGGTSRNSLVGA
jgi:hypothetical protein